jgi:hypothetical protein
LACEYHRPPRRPIPGGTLGDVGSKGEPPRGSSDPPGSGIKARPRIDVVLARSDTRALLEEARYHFAVASGIDHAQEPERHQGASLPAAVALWRVVDLVTREPENANLPRDSVYHYVVNRAYAELTAPFATESQRRHHYLSVHLPAGRPPTRTNLARQTLVNEIRARPEMPNYKVMDRAIQLGVWMPDQADDPANVKRRIRRLRQDATK